jgi:hypothetical protein
MGSKDEHACESAKEKVLSNDLLTKRLAELEERVRRLEASLSPNVTWGVSQDELAETEKANED